MISFDEDKIFFDIFFPCGYAERRNWVSLTHGERLFLPRRDNEGNNRIAQFNRYCQINSSNIVGGFLHKPFISSANKRNAAGISVRRKVSQEVREPNIVLRSQSSDTTSKATDIVLDLHKGLLSVHVQCILRVRYRSSESAHLPLSFSSPTGFSLIKVS